MTSEIPSETFLASGDYLAVVRDFAFSKGISTATLLRDSEIALEDLINPPSLVNNFIVSRIGINLYEAIDEPEIDAVHFGLCMTAASHGSLGVAVQCAADLEQAYGILREFYNTRVNSQNIVMKEDSGYLKISLVPKYPELIVDEAVTHFFDLATLVSIASNTYRALNTEHIEGCIELHINAQEPEGFPYESLPNIKVQFSRDELELWLPLTWKHQPLAVANPELARMAVARCESELKQISPKDLVASVRARLYDCKSELPSLEVMAEEFHLAPATFKRRLKAHGTSYLEIKNEVRLSLARQLILEQGFSMEAIAEQLGFSDASNFSKSFKGWTGMTPKQYRESASEFDSQ